MQNNLNVTDQVLMDTASAYRGNISKMRTILEEATSNINRTSSIWEGMAGEELRSKYERLKSSFEPFCQTVEECAKFLDKAAATYKETESAIQRAAEETLSSVE